MNKTELKSLILSEIRSVLKESIEEPSEQVFKEVMKQFQAETGIHVAMPILSHNSKQYNMIVYTTDLSKELRTPVLKALFRTLRLRVVVNEMRDSIGGYSFTFSFEFTHPNGRSNGIELGTAFYNNNKITYRPS